MRKILKLIPGIAFLADSLNALFIIIKYSIGINVQVEEERADPDDPKWENNTWYKRLLIGSKGIANAVEEDQS